MAPEPPAGRFVAWFRWGGWSLGGGLLVLLLSDLLVRLGGPVPWRPVVDVVAATMVVAGAILVAGALVLERRYVKARRADAASPPTPGEKKDWLWRRYNRALMITVFAMLVVLLGYFASPTGGLYPVVAWLWWPALAVAVVSATVAARIMRAIRRLDAG